jgi:uncharacterized beta-barrel protein YwiB (DUF1934 family)
LVLYMDNKYNVSISMESESDGERSSVLAKGVLYHKWNNWFLRYEEPDHECGITTTTLRVSTDQIKLMRRGGVESDMTFESGTVQEGFYTTPYIHMRFEIATQDIHVELQEGKGVINWRYELIIDGASPSQQAVTVLLS